MIVLKGIRLDSVSITIDNGEIKTSGKYSLMSNVGKVVATQGFNSYNDIKIDLSSGTHARLAKFLEGLSYNVQQTLGLVEEEVTKVKEVT